MSAKPARRRSIKDSIKKVLCRPKGKYVPLPVGGYPLPDTIKRRFALPPRLPDINRLSLIPDFTSSLYGEKWSKAIEQSLTQEQPRRTRTPKPLDPPRSRYIIVPDEPTTIRPLQIPCRIYETLSKPRTLRRIRGHENLASFRERSIASPTLTETFAMAKAATFARAHRQHDSGSEVTLVDDDSRTEDPKGNAQPSLNANIDAMAAAIYSPEAEDSVDAARPFSGASFGFAETAVYNPIGGLDVNESINASRPFSGASLDSVATAIFTPENDPRVDSQPVDARPVSEASLDSIEAATYIPPAPKPDKNSMRKVIESVPNLLNSFCILDLQIFGSPIRVTTQDLIPQETTKDGEAFFIDEAYLETSWEIKTADYGARQAHQIIVQGDLVDASDVTLGASHRFTGQLDVTGLLKLLELERDPHVEEDDYDVWLALAHEEMDRLGIHRTIRDCHKSQEIRDRTTSDSLKQEEKAIQILRDLHNDYLIIGPSGAQEPGKYQITHLSPSLAHDMSPEPKSSPLQSLFDVETLRRSMDKGERFVVRAMAEGEEMEKRLYCIPMFGPTLTCWLCFLVNDELGCFWKG